MTEAQPITKQAARNEAAFSVAARLGRPGRHTRPLGCSPVKADATRLVQGSKCPTGQKEPVDAPSVYRPGTVLRLEYREWSDQYRVRASTAVTPDQEPPPQGGDRWTWELSERGAHAIADSCEYVTVTQGGYNAFLTMTLTPEARERVNTYSIQPPAERDAGENCAGDVAEGKFCMLPDQGATGIEVGGEIAAGPFTWLDIEWHSSVQREVSRFFDAAQRIVARGWVPAYFRGRTQETPEQPRYTPITWNREGWRLRGCWYHLKPCRDDETGAEFTPVKRAAGAEKMGRSLSYLWVAENPENAEGERNPHLHVLMRWTVPYSVFPCWARRIESLWGQGYAHIERLKARKAAGYYIAKAAGYLTKGAGEADQGPIRGNRYGISRPARAPGWYHVGSYAWGIFGALMERARESYKARTAPVREVRDQCREKLKTMPKGSAERRKLAATLAAARKRLESVGGYCGRWEIVVKGMDRVDKLLTWAQRKGWDMEAPPPGVLASRVDHNVMVRRQRREWREWSAGWLEWVRSGTADRWEPVSYATEERNPEIPEKPRPEPYSEKVKESLAWWAERARQKAIAEQAEQCGVFA